MGQSMADARMIILHRIVMVAHRGMGLVFLGVANARKGVRPEQDREHQKSGQQGPHR